MTDKIQILVGVTFRDFSGTDNDKIQKLFLESINNQTYVDWKLVVTVFNEKFVQQEVDKIVSNAVYYDNGPIDGHKFSLTDVLANTINESKKVDMSVILWTTCDVIFEPNFFQKITDNYSKNFFAVSHPHITFSSIDDLGSNNYITSSINTGMDLIIMDGEIFKSAENFKIICKYKFYDWGIFEHFLVGFSQLFQSQKINLFGISNISKIENDRVVNNETNTWLLNCWLKNKVVLDRFISEYKLSRHLDNLTYCHSQFRLLTCRYRHTAIFYRDYLRYYREILKSALLPCMPLILKKIVKKAIQ